MYGRGYNPRRRFTRRFARAMRPVRLVNHYQTTITYDVAESFTAALFTGTDTPTSRSIDIQSNSKITKLTVVATPQTIVPGLQQLMLLYRPGAVSLTTPLTNYYATTEPVTEEMIKARRYKLGGPITRRVITGQLYPQQFRFSKTFRKGLLMRDGDDIILSGISSLGAVTMDIRATAQYYSG